jgi:hypothetical protein
VPGLVQATVQGPTQVEHALRTANRLLLTRKTMYTPTEVEMYTERKVIAGKQGKGLPGKRVIFLKADQVPVLQQEPGKAPVPPLREQPILRPGAAVLPLSEPPILRRIGQV